MPALTQLERARRRVRQPVTRQQAGFLASTATHLAFVGGIGSGKTRAGAMWGAREAVRAPGVGFIGANIYSQLHRATVKTFLAVLEDWGFSYIYGRRPPASWGHSPFPSHDNIVSLRARGQLRQVVCASLVNADLLRGIEIRWAWLDETRDTPRSAFDVVLGRLRDGPPGTQRIAVTTSPNGHDWLYDAFAGDGETALPDREVVRATTYSNPWLPPGYATNLLRVYSKRLAAQEVEGLWVNLTEGQAFAEFTRSRHVTATWVYRDDLPIVHSLDFNVNPLCSVVLQTDPRTGAVHVIDEIRVEGSARTRDATDEFVRRYGGHRGMVHVYGDRSARSRDTRSDQTDMQIIEQAYRQAFGGRVAMRMNRANPDVAASVQDVNSLLLSATRQTRLFVSPRCVHLIRDLEETHFKPGTREIDKSDPARTHHSDALRYYVSMEHPALSRAVGAFTPRGI